MSRPRLMPGQPQTMGRYVSVSAASGFPSPQHRPSGTSSLILRRAAHSRTENAHTHTNRGGPRAVTHAAPLLYVQA